MRVGIVLDLAKAGQQADGLDDFGFLQRNHPPVQAGAAPVAAAAPFGPAACWGRFPAEPWELPTAPVPSPPPPPPPALAPSAAAINCSSFCGSFNHCLNSGPRVWAAICAAMLTSPVSGSAATNFTSLILMVLLVLPPLPPLSASLICLVTSCAFEPASGEGPHQSGEVVDGHVFGEVQAGQSCCVQQSAQSSSRPVRPRAEFRPSAACCRRRPAGSRLRRPWADPAAARLHVTSNCASVRLWSNPYMRAYLIRMLRLWTKARADAADRSWDVLEAVIKGSSIRNSEV